ncbi:transglycosylase SLT domain-containing protein [Streptomyces flaveolus]|uniref:transglycosylase SLT domain-containing protein n=1 Tax=Streptomyces flaveolus TaxID=67297 RepID=UPI0033D3DACE
MGKLSPDIGPVVIVAQIDVESGFKADKSGPRGEEGISQLPPDVFARLGKDDDDNGKTSALDAADSILAQGRFMCELVDRVSPFATLGKPLKDALSLALSAYDAGPDTVREVKGVPRTGESRQYALSVRSQSAKYLGGMPPRPQRANQTEDTEQ